MMGLAKIVAEGRMRREGRCAWRACSAGDAEFPKTGPCAGGGAERRVADGGSGVMFHDPDRSSGLIAGERPDPAAACDACGNGAVRKGIAA